MNGPDEEMDARHAVMDAQLRARIDQHGYTFIGVFDPEGEKLPFVYTIGLTNRGWPELLMIGAMHPAVAQSVIVEVIKQWESLGNVMIGTMRTGGLLDDGTDCRMELRRVNPEVAIEEYACQVPNFTTGPHAVVQVLWPDNHGFYPYDSAYDKRMIQPMLPEVH